jgi:tetrahydromethanopterin S-methyltransferase subunit G
MSDLNTKILIEIRDEIRGTNGRLDQVEQRVDQTNQRLDQVNERVDRLHRRQVETEVRLTTELVAVVGAIHEVRDAVMEQQGFGARIADHEQRISKLEHGSVE